MRTSRCILISLFLVSVINVAIAEDVSFVLKTNKDTYQLHEGIYVEWKLINNTDNRHLVKYPDPHANLHYLLDSPEGSIDSWKWEAEVVYTTYNVLLPHDSILSSDLGKYENITQGLIADFCAGKHVFSAFLDSNTVIGQPKFFSQQILLSIVDNDTSAMAKDYDKIRALPTKNYIVEKMKAYEIFIEKYPNSAFTPEVIRDWLSYSHLFLPHTTENKAARRSMISNLIISYPDHPEACKHLNFLLLDLDDADGDKFTYCFDNEKQAFAFMDSIRSKGTGTKVGGMLEKAMKRKEQRGCYTGSKSMPWEPIPWPKHLLK